MTVAFVFTNPRHHLEMMAPIADALAQRGVAYTLISLAEFRGFDTPRDGRRLRRAIPFNIRKRADEVLGAPVVKPGRGRAGKLVRAMVWHALRLRLRLLLRGARIVVVPNDVVYPYRELLADLARADRRAVLVQEGIRFAVPASAHEPAYGSGGTAAILAWGEGSRDYFIAHGAPPHAVHVTGSPRFDALDIALWRMRARDLLATRGITAPPLAFLSNPIELVGYGSRRAKLELFARFLAESAGALRGRQVPIVVKTHMHEDPSEFARIAAQSELADHVTFIDDAPIFSVIAGARAAIVLSSTVGLEAMLFGVPVGQLEIPGHGFPFEYVEQGAAVPLCTGKIAAGVERLLDATAPHHDGAAAFVERHLHGRGQAAHNAAAVIERLLRT